MARSRFLIAVSSPWASQRLVTSIADLARRLDAEVIVAHVARRRDEDEQESDARQRGEQTLKLMTDGLKEASIDNEALMLFSDDITKAILKTARSRNCTLVILGMSHKGPLKRLFEGDVPHEILRNSEIPVMVCPTEWAATL